jgi:hypothetical protein
MFSTTLSDLFSNDDKIIIEKQNEKPILIWDATNLAHRCVYVAIFKSPEDNDKFYFFKHLFMNNLFNTIKQFNPQKVILAFDSRNYWRCDYYAEYKAHRKAARDKAVVDFDKFYPVLNAFKDQIKNVFSNIYICEYPRAEADDIIAILSKKQFKNNKNIIISTDSDFHQLLVEKNIQQYDPFTNKMVNSLNPQKELDIKIIMGDKKSDNIPAIKPKTGPVTAEKILNDGLQDFLENAENAECKKKYTRNRILIDFNYIPDTLANEILNMYNQYVINPINKNKLIEFFAMNKLNLIMNDWNNYSELIKSLS